jgi:hypothetical protein
MRLKLRQNSSNANLIMSYSFELVIVARKDAKKKE